MPPYESLLLALCPEFPDLVLPDVENAFDIVLRPCQTLSGRKAGATPWEKL